MKKLIASTLTLLALACGVLAEEKHDHNKVIPGPKGGKVVEVEGGHAEFFVQPDKKVSVTFYGEDMKPIIPAGQVVTLVAEAPAGRAKLDFEKASESFVSKEGLPEGDGYRVVLQIRNSPDAKPQNLRIDYHTEVCGECKRAEYACVCPAEGGGQGGHGH